MLSVLRAVNRHLTIAIPAAMAAGFLYGMILDAAPLKGFIPLFTFLMVFPMMVTLRYRVLFTSCAFLTQGLTQIFNLAVIPATGFALGRLFFPDSPYLALGLLLAAVIPTSGMTVSWTGFARGNVEVAVKMMIIGLTLGSLLTPFYVKVLLGASVQVQTRTVLAKILQVVFIPMAAGITTRFVLMKKLGPGWFPEKARGIFPPIATLGVLGMVFSALALRAEVIAANPVVLLRILVPVVIFYLAVLVIGVLTGRALLPRADAVALVYGTTLRNLSIALAIAMGAFGKAGAEAALVIAAAFIVQTQVAAWSVKYMDRMLGSVN